MFNQYMWQLYLKAGGNETVKCFEENLSNEFTEDYISFINGLHREYQLSDAILSDEHEQLSLLLEYYRNGNSFCDGTCSAEDALDLLIYILSDNGSRDAKCIFSDFTFSLANFSTMLSVSLPESFVPYYFKWNFNVLQTIADSFGIELPAIPNKSDYEGRLYYYEDICAALHAFRTKNNLTPYELYAFLYDFAPKYIGGVSSYLITELPEPRSAYFIGGSRDDLFLSDQTDAVTPWQCNPGTRAGDMILMYLRTPVSAVDSVWRSCSVGFIDPFFLYYRCTYISHPQKLKAVTLEQLRADKITGTMPIVRKNMQGINGVELQPSEYNRILQIGRSKAKKLEFVSISTKGEFGTEKEVEEHIIKPLLEQFGFSEQDYVQQLYLEIGNHNHALIPDFVLLPEKHGNRQTAFAVIEAKRSITGAQELEAALSQVRSYAKLLGTRYAGIISQEKIWIYDAKDDFSAVKLSSAFPLSDDVLYAVRKILNH